MQLLKRGPFAFREVDQVARTYAPALRRFFGRRIREEVDVDDLVQEVLLRLCRRGGLGDVGNVEGYLFQTAANVLRDRARQRLSRKAGSHDAFGDEHENVGADAVLLPEQVLQGREAVRWLAEALLALPDRTRAVFVLCRIERMPYTEVAKGLGISLSAVNKHLAKAMDTLMEGMKEVL